MTPGKNVLEIGSGVALDTHTMASRGLHLTKVGVDTARQRLSRHQMPANFLATDACHLPFPQDSFDFGTLPCTLKTTHSIPPNYRF